MTTADPGNVGYGRITWRGVTAKIDGSDPDSFPDWSPAAKDIRVTFEPGPAWLLNLTADGGPVTILPELITCSINDDGNLIDWAPTSPDDTPPESVHEYVDLVATDDPDNNPHDWTYNVRIRGTGIDRHFSILVPEGSEQDLSALMPVAASKGNAVVVGPAGASAYEVAVANGFEGTPAEWLASITSFAIAPVAGHDGILQVSGLQMLPEVSPGIFALDL